MRFGMLRGRATGAHSPRVLPTAKLERLSKAWELSLSACWRCYDLGRWMPQNRTSLPQKRPTPQAVRGTQWDAGPARLLEGSRPCRYRLARRVLVESFDFVVDTATENDDVCLV